MRSADAQKISFGVWLNGPVSRPAACSTRPAFPHRGGPQGEGPPPVAGPLGQIVKRGIRGDRSALAHGLALPGGRSS